MNLKDFDRKLPAACVLAACAQFAGGAALANDDGGFYGRLYTGINNVGTDSLTQTVDGNTTSADADFTASFTGGGAFGYRYGDRWRVELDAAYRSAEVDRIAFDGGATYTDGNFASLTLGLTGIYDFKPFGAGRNWTPYIGLGLAYVQEVDIDFEDDSGEISFESDDFALSALGGLRYESSQRWFADGELRYFNLGDVDLDGGTPGTGQVTADYDPLSFTFGFGWNF